MTEAREAVFVRPAGLEDLPCVRACFKEYTAWLDQDISFQNYEDEYANLPGKYAPPTGGLLLAIDAVSDDILGCVAFRKLVISDGYRSPYQFLNSSNQYCELKRLYVFPEARGKHAARRLTQAAIDSARIAGYQKIFLDTMPWMHAALSLYRSEGFDQTTPYYHSPLEGTLFFVRDL
ncbi:Acyl-CoA N-acyltransferase [Moelleriella libera RCEF 2490]|uniref:Acyl-CoA N-acyltransferase n=1 Tax=Moelleriella libera RCEF 2490 TaxID=1081109 RepID=A0A168EF45_9HYPO|nr:Acyl-CoA N-acyltransferase [Moelleriella libera RCEF 2490]